MWLWGWSVVGFTTCDRWGFPARHGGAPKKWYKGTSHENGWWTGVPLWLSWKPPYSSAWWFGTFFIFPYIGFLIIPIDYYFQEGWPNHQPVIYLLLEVWNDVTFGSGWTPRSFMKSSWRPGMTKSMVLQEPLEITVDWNLTIYFNASSIKATIAILGDDWEMIHDDWCWPARVTYLLGGLMYIQLGRASTRYQLHGPFLWQPQMSVLPYVCPKDVPSWFSLWFVCSGMCSGSPTFGLSNRLWRWRWRWFREDWEKTGLKKCHAINKIKPHDGVAIWVWSEQQQKFQGELMTSSQSVLKPSTTVYIPAYHGCLWLLLKCHFPHAEICRLTSHRTGFWNGPSSSSSCHSPLVIAADLGRMESWLMETYQLEFLGKAKQTENPIEKVIRVKQKSS